MSGEDVQALAYTARVLEDYINSLVARETLLSRLLSEHKAALDAIQSIPESGETECMLPVGGGVSVPVKVRGDTRYLVFLGAGVFAKKDKTDVTRYLNRKVEELERALAATVEQRRRTEEQLLGVQERLQRSLQAAEQQ